MVRQGNQVPTLTQLLNCIMLTPWLKAREETEGRGVGALTFEKSYGDKRWDIKKQTELPALQL